jgi:hypothetical protein
VTAVRIMATHGPFTVGRRAPRTGTVLSIGRLGVASGADYYLANVANSVDDYYLGKGEAPGRWIGATSANLGLSGVVDPVALRNLLDGRGADGEDLGIMRRADRPRRRGHRLGTSPMTTERPARDDGALDALYGSNRRGGREKALRAEAGEPDRTPNLEACPAGGPVR